MSLILDQLVKVHDVSKEQSTNIVADIAAAGTALTVDDTTGFAKDDYIILGDIGEEQTEIVQISATVSSATQLTITATQFPHYTLGKVFRALYNQVKVYRCDTEDGTFAEITGSPFAMEVDQLYTYVVDPTGTLAKYYKYSYYNSTAPRESGKSAASLGGVPEMLCTLGEIKREINMKPEDKTIDDLLIEFVKAATDKVMNYTKIRYVSKTITEEKYDVPSEINRIHTDFYPIYGTPTEVKDHNTVLTYDADPDDTEYYLYKGYVVKKYGDFFSGRQKFSISYVAYEPDLPSEVKDVVIQMAAILSGRKVRTYVDEMGVTQAAVITEIPKRLWEVLDRYKRVVF